MISREVEEQRNKVRKKEMGEKEKEEKEKVK